MLTQILQLELLLKAGAGACLLFFPITTARLFGIPHGDVTIWARLLGTLLIGIGGAIYIEHDVPNLRGLGLPGLIVINLAAVLALLAHLLITGAGSRRAAIAMWATVAALFGLSLLEILQT